MDNFIEVAFFDIGNTLVIRGDGWIPGAKSALEELHRRNIRLGLLSNTGNLNRDQVRDLLPADFNFDLFEDDLIIFSSEVGIEKPDERIFTLAIDRAQVLPEKCLFCTEDPVDISVAGQSGMRTVKVQEPPASDISSLIDNLVSAGLLPS